MNIWKSKKVTVQVEGSVNAILPATYEIVPPMVAPTTFPASNVTLGDAGSRYTATEVETALQEIAGSGRTTETVKANKALIDILTATQKLTDLMENQKLIGMVPATSATLTSLISSGIAYVENNRIVMPEASHTYTASKDTYIDVSNVSTYTFVEVANGAAYPALTSNSLRVAKVVTNGTAITSVDIYAENLMIGLWAGQNNTKGWKNTFMGYRAGEKNTEGSWNSFYGYYAGNLNTTGNYDTFLGYGCGRANTTGINNTSVGFESCHLNEDGGNNTVLGFQAGQANVSGDNNTMLGALAGYSTTDSDNVMIGNRAGILNTTGKDNVFIGSSVAETNDTGSQNTFIGRSAGYFNTASNNTFIGFHAGINSTSGSLNTFLGVQAGDANATGASNTFMGYNAGLLNVNSYNTGIGSNSLAANISGYMNTAIGEESGDAITTGASNTFIGGTAGHGAGQKVDAVNSIAIGFEAVTDASNICQIGNTSLTSVQSHGSFEAQDIGDGFICKSPDGTRYKITVANGGGSVTIAAA